jgi:IstB-like ATP binding protein
VAAAAQREQLTHAGFLAELLLAECDDWDRRRSARRLKAARFPREKWLTDFDYAANPNIAPAVIANLATCAWIAKGEPLCLIGDSGAGKPPHRFGRPRRPTGPPGQVRARRQAGERAGRGRRRPTAVETIAATAESIFCAWTSSATWSWTGVGPSCCSRC